MKPEIDIDNPLVETLVSIYKQQCAKSIAIASKFENAIRPLFYPKNLIGKPQQIGSCVVLKAESNIFLLSASHVFEMYGKYQIQIACGKEIFTLPGDRYSYKQGLSGTHQDDKIDASIFHLQGDIPDEIRCAAITTNDLDLVDTANIGSFYVMLGFRSNQSKVFGKTTKSRLELYPSIEIDSIEYEGRKLDYRTHTALNFEDQYILGRHWKPSPKLHGMSGGAIVRIETQKVNGIPIVDISKNCKLSAIIIERIPGDRNKLPIVLGTKVGAHITLIQRHVNAVQ
jgi:hypothetical protein